MGRYFIGESKLLHTKMDHSSLQMGEQKGLSTPTYMYVQIPIVIKKAENL